MTFFSDRIFNIKPSPTIAISTKAKELKAGGKDVIDLSVGEPDFNTPDHVKSAGINAINQNRTRYTAVGGVIELKNAIIAKFKNENGLEYKPNEVMASCGAKQIIFNAFLATINEGDEVIIPAPYWVSYPDIVLLFGGKPVTAETDEKDGFKIKAENLEKFITNKTKWLVMNSPSNPTGMVYTKKELEDIAVLLRKYPHVNVMSDDIYEHLIYDNEKFYNILMVAPDLKDRVLVINGVSKSYAMTGWRIGYVGGNKEIIAAMDKIQSQSTTSASTISQYASVEALLGNQDYISYSKGVFADRRNACVDMFNKIDGIKCSKSQGAFYLFPSCSALFGKKTPNGDVIKNSADFCNYILEEALVSAVPGSAFGKEGYFRISYATSMENLKSAIERIKSGVERLR